MSGVKARIASLSHRRIMLLLMALALVLRVLSVFMREAIQLDETVYVHMAESIAGGLGFKDITGVTSTNFLPTFPMFIAGVGVIFRDYVLAGYIVSVTFGVLLLIPVYLLGRELVGEKAGLFAAALVAVNPYLVDLSSRIYSENLFMFFILLALLFSRHMMRGCRVPCSILAGSALGFAYLVNPFSLLYLVIIILLSAGIALRRGVWRHMAKALAVFLVSFAVYAAPLVLYFHSELDQWTYTGKNPGVVYAASEFIRMGTIGWDQHFLRLTGDGSELFINDLEAEYPGAVGNLLEDPARSVNVVLQQGNIFLDEKLQQVFPRWLIPLMALGLFSAGWSRKQASQVGYVLLMVSPALFLLFVDSVPRYFVAYTPLLMLWAAQGWLRAEGWGNKTVALCFEQPWRDRLEGYAAPLVAMAIIVPLVVATPLMLERNTYPLHMREAGEWIRQEHGEGSRIMSREYTSSYYADASVVIMPYDDYQRTTNYAKEQAVDYLVATRNDITYWRPTMAGLLEGVDKHPGWKLVTTLEPGTDNETYIFRLDL